jgi:hypothetical protein
MSLMNARLNWNGFLNFLSGWSLIVISALAGANGGLEANTIFISCLPESVTEDSIVALLSETAAIKVSTHGYLLYYILSLVGLHCPFGGGARICFVPSPIVATSLS